MPLERETRVTDDPSGGWAKATEATANASKEAIRAGRDLGRFISGPAGEVVGMLWDHLKVVRFERQVRLAGRVRHFLAERELAGPNRTIPLKVGLPLLDNATLEEDDDLQDVWARLLVNGGDADSGTEIRRSFVSVLAEMTPLDVRNLAQIDIAIKMTEEDGIASSDVWTYELPERAIPYAEGQLKGQKNPSPALDISLSNLDRLGCILLTGQTSGGGIISAKLTPFGRAFIEACTR
jgi:hypothetical protein